MGASGIVRNAVGRFQANELILASKLYKRELSDQITEAAYYKTLERMCKSGELVKIAKGTYHIPKTGRFGIVPPSEKEIVSAFTEHGTGTVVGYSLYNTLNLTTQISKNINVMSSELEGFTKTIRNVTVHLVPLRYTETVKNMVHGLDVLQNFSSIQDINYSAFLSYAEKLSAEYDESAVRKVIAVGKYKKSTVAFLREILNYYHRENTLDRYLSSLSDYKIPKMEELYEASRASV